MSPWDQTHYTIMGERPCCCCCCYCWGDDWPIIQVENTKDEDDEYLLLLRWRCTRIIPVEDTKEESRRWTTLLLLLLLLRWRSAAHHSWWRCKRSSSRNRRRRWRQRQWWWWSTVNCCCCWRDDLLNQIQTRNRIEVIIYIKGTNQDEDDKRKREGKEVTHSFYKKKKYILSCRTRFGTVQSSCTDGNG